MSAPERFVKICGEIGNFTARTTGVSIVDAYFGDPQLSPDMLSQDKDADTLITDIGATMDTIREMPSSLRRDYLIGETRSLETLVHWINGDVRFS